MSNTADIAATVKDFLLREFLPGEDPAQLEMSTPLITSGILDSIATLKLVGYLEDTFRITIAAHEADKEHLNTITDIERLVRGKQGAARKDR
jgi:acyl carrier protein